MDPVTAAMPDQVGPPGAVQRASAFPRLRYMGSKYRLVPHLAAAFAEVGGTTALDAFSGSGIVSYLLKALGYQVTANDFLTFPAAITRATVVNQDITLTAADIAAICGPAADDRDFIQRTFGGLYFTGEDLRFLDSAWSHMDQMTGAKQAVACRRWSCPRRVSSPAASSLSPGCATTTAAATCGSRCATISGSGPRVQPGRVRQRAALCRGDRRRLRR